MPESEGGHSPGRRKVRKGTQSCWECKRRKVRCIFPSHPTDAKCNNCRRRKTKCIGQHLEDTRDHLHTNVARAKASNDHDALVTRLAHVEEILSRVVDNTNFSPLGGREFINEITPSSLTEGTYNEASLERLRRAGSGSNSRTCDRRASPRVPSDGVLQQDPGSLEPPASDQRSAASSTSNMIYNTGHGSIIEQLVSAWPCRRDLDRIINIKSGYWTHLYTKVTTSSHDRNDRIPSPRDVFHLPSRSAHPVHFAQKLLLLATYLQSVDSRAARTLQEQGTPCHKIMSCLFEKANTMVASQDGLVTSLEGIQSLLLVAAYHNHSGDLTLAWMAIHRANGIAQVLGMHRGNSAPFSHRPHQGEQDAPCARTLSVLLVDMDLYLSMMLGLPQSTGAIQQAVMREVDRESNPPLEQLRHVHCFVASQILQRSYVASPLHQNVHELDQQVQKAAAAMPSQWWLVPNMDVANREGQSILHGTNRLMIQVVHYHLLLRLHLPGMLGSSSDQRHDVSKMTATHSARELLARYIALRRADRIPFHCCGTDLVAFVAVTVLCLAHIDSRNHDQASPFNFSFLTHSRLGDRAVMEHALELVQEASQEDSQTITSKVARMMRHLLDVEASSVGGTIYNATSAKGQDQEYDGGTELKASHHGLHIYIPWFGTIKFERGAISTLPPSANHQNDLHQSQPTHSRLSTMEGISQMKGNGIPNHWDRGMAHCDAPAATAGAQQLPSFQSKVDAVLHSQPGPPAEFQSTFETNEPQTSLSQESPWILGTEEDWNAQGVDIALLNSIFSSNESADAWQAFISEQPEPVPPRNATHIA